MKILAELRLIEAKILLDNKKYEGCNYLLGYVIELALKAAICKLLKIENYPTNFNCYKTHELKDLLTLSGLKKDLDDIGIYESNYNVCWSEILQWKETYRYKISSEYNKNSSDEEFSINQYNSVYFIFNWIKEKW